MPLMLPFIRFRLPINEHTAKSTAPTFFSLRLRPLQELGLDQPRSLPTWLMAFRRLGADFYTGGDSDVAY